MDREDITRMAREAGFVGFDGSNAMLCKFAALVAAHKREWVGLTDEERHSIREWQEIQKELGPVWAPMMLYLYLAIEAKLKEKNHG